MTDLSLFFNVILFKGCYLNDQNSIHQIEDNKISSFLANGAHLPGKRKTQNYSNSSVNFKNWFQTPGDDVCITENALRAVLQKEAVR